MDRKDALAALAALAQETRLDVFRLLLKQAPDGVPAGEIAARLGVVQNTMSAHLAVLSRAGLIAARRRGRVVAYAIEPRSVRDFIAFLLEDCCRGAPEICAPLLDIVAGGACDAAPGKRTKDTAPA